MDNFSEEFAHAVDKNTFYDPYKHPPRPTAANTTRNYLACTRARSEVEILGKSAKYLEINNNLSKSWSTKNNFIQKYAIEVDKIIENPEESNFQPNEVKPDYNENSMEED